MSLDSEHLAGKEYRDDPRAREQAVSLGLLSAALVRQDDTLATALIEEVRNAGVSRHTVREIILQSYLHDGYATALEGVTLLQRVWPEAPGKPLENYSDWANWRTRGEVLFRTIYGSVADKVKQTVGEGSPDLAEWMVVEGYGKVLSRPGVDRATRELATVAVLIMKRRPRQLYSHLRGALRVSVTIEEIGTLIQLIRTRFNARDEADLAEDLLRKLPNGSE